MPIVDSKSPLYLKLSIITVGLLSFFFILYLGQNIIVPIIFSTIIAILLNPVVNFLCKKKFNRIIAILLVVTASVILLTTVAYFIFSQAALLSDSLPQFKNKFVLLLEELINWFSTNSNISETKIIAWLNRAKSEGLNSSTAVIGTALKTAGGFLTLIFLMPVYIFLILFYKPLLLEFIAQLFKNSENEVISEVLSESKILINSYLIGLLLEAALVAILNSVGLLILGIQYAILIGVIGALLNMIPYIGGIVAISLPMIMAFATQSPIVALWVLVLYIVVQFIDNNVIVPKIVSSKVKINALISIIVVLIGGALWGVAGMFLSIPITAIIKVIFDRITPLKPFGFLLGDNQPEIIKFRINKKKLNK